MGCDIRGQSTCLDNKIRDSSRRCTIIKGCKEIYLPVTLKCTPDSVLVTFHSHANNKKNKYNPTDK